MSLTQHERETVIRWSDGEPVATITTHQRTVITKLRRNPAAVEVEDLTHRGTVGARFEFPAELLSFRSRRVARELTEEQRAETAERLRRGRAQQAV